MASAAEQLASNLNWGSIGKATELKKRLWFTIGALLVFRIGAYIPVPGVDPVALAEVFGRNSGGIAGMLDVFSGGNPSTAVNSVSLFPSTRITAPPWNASQMTPLLSSINESTV